MEQDIAEYVRLRFFFLHLEFLEVGAAFLPGSPHDVQEVWREHKGNPLLADSHETLVIAQDVAKVDVEEISCRNTQRVKRVGFGVGNIHKGGNLVCNLAIRLK